MEHLFDVFFLLTAAILLLMLLLLSQRIQIKDTTMYFMWLKGKWHLSVFLYFYRIFF